jgi:hypothetical protein
MDGECVAHAVREPDTDIDGEIVERTLAVPLTVPVLETVAVVLAPRVAVAAVEADAAALADGDRVMRLLRDGLDDTLVESVSEGDAEGDCDSATEGDAEVDAVPLLDKEPDGVTDALFESDMLCVTDDDSRVLPESADERVAVTDGVVELDWLREIVGVADTDIVLLTDAEAFTEAVAIEAVIDAVNAVDGDSVDVENGELDDESHALRERLADALPVADTVVDEDKDAETLGVVEDDDDDEWLTVGEPVDDALTDDDRDGDAVELALSVPVADDENESVVVAHSVLLPDRVRKVDFVRVSLTVAQIVADGDLVRDGELVPHEDVDAVGVADAVVETLDVVTTDAVTDSEPETVAVDDTVDDDDDVEHGVDVEEMVIESDTVIDPVPDVVVEAVEQADTETDDDVDRENEGLEDGDCVGVCDCVVVEQPDADADGVAELERLEQLDDDGETDVERERLPVAHAEFDPVPVPEAETEREPTEDGDGVKEPERDFWSDTDCIVLGEAEFDVEIVGEYVAEGLAERDRDGEEDWVPVAVCVKVGEPVGENVYVDAMRRTLLLVSSET